MYGFIIEVTGNILFEDGAQIVQGISSGGVAHEDTKFKCEYGFVPDKRLVEGDIIFDKKHRAIPYASYFAHGAVACSEVSSKTPGVKNYFEESIYDIKELLEKPIDPDIQSVFYKQLYLDVFSALELYLSEYILVRIYSDDVFYSKAVDYWKNNSKTKKFDRLSPTIIEKKTNNYIFMLVYHQFDRIDKLFRFVLGFGLPDYSRLKRALRKRHAVIHRNSISGYDRMEVVEISKEDVATLIKDAEQFYKELESL